MKIRNGFVSNSSSSSYVIITTQEAYDNVMKKLSKIEAGAVKEVFCFDKKKLFDKQILVSTSHVCTEDLGYDWDFIEEDNEVQLQEAIEGIDKFYNLMSKEKDTITENFN